jgi:hypothetical protein
MGEEGRDRRTKLEAEEAGAGAGAGDAGDAVVVDAGDVGEFLSDCADIVAVSVPVGRRRIRDQDAIGVYHAMTRIHNYRKYKNTCTRI